MGHWIVKHATTESIALCFEGTVFITPLSKDYSNLILQNLLFTINDLLVRMCTFFIVFVSDHQYRTSQD